jgi:hypothetical protein
VIEGIFNDADKINPALPLLEAKKLDKWALYLAELSLFRGGGL